MKDKVLKYISFGTLAVLIVMMAAATVLESMHGSQYALSHIYHSPLFIALWFIAAAAGLVYILKRRMQAKPATLALHLAFVLMLAGALTTHLTGKNGSLTLLPGETKDSCLAEDGSSIALPFSITLQEFSIDYYPGSRMPRDYVSRVVLDGKESVISMNRIGKAAGWRLYQADYDLADDSTTLALSHDPWGIGITYAGYLLLLLSMIAFFFQKGTAFRVAASKVRPALAWGIGAACLVSVLVMMRKFIFTGGSQLMPVLRTPLLQVHVISIVLAYFIFIATFVIGIIGLFSSEARAARLRDLSLTLLTPAVFLITFGTFLGAVWANISWGNYWAWDPKETWALITLLIYAATLHAGSLKFLSKPRSFHIYCIVALASVAITYFGVNMLLGGMHSYA